MICITPPLFVPYRQADRFRVFNAYLSAFMLLIMSGILAMLVDMVDFFAYIRCGSQIRL